MFAHHPAREVIAPHAARSPRGELSGKLHRSRVAMRRPSRRNRARQVTGSPHPSARAPSAASLRAPSDRFNPVAISTNPRIAAKELSRQPTVNTCRRL
jgi:hypothetical protein